VVSKLRFRRRWLPFVLAALALVTLSSTASAWRARADAKTPKPASAKAWKQLVAKAKSEGKVTIFSTQIPTLLADMADKFKKKYGISVTVNRNVDNVLVTQINTGISTGNLDADIWVANSRPYVLGAQKNAWIAQPVGPHFFAKTFDRAKFSGPGTAFVAGTAPTGFGWNKQLYPKGLKSYKDLLAPALKGRIGVLQPLSPVAVDFWLWLQETQGKSFITKLAAQNPKKYPSAVPTQQALASGEITGAIFISTVVKDLIAQGAPIGFKLPAKAWNTPYYAQIMKRAPHPAAAQLLADYMVSPEGQAIIAHNTGAVVKKVKSTYYVPPRIPKLKELTPAKVAAYQAYWNNLFK
jgi:iron(III) transport system substrate-binding protein